MFDPRPSTFDLQSPNIAGIILAGGASVRMGMPKACLRSPDGTTLLSQQVDLLRASGCADVIVVVGAHAREIPDAHPELAVQWVVNERWQLGQCSSLQAGLGACASATPRGALILPVDVPGVATATAKAIVETALGNPHLDAVIPEFEGHGGHPLFLSAAFCRTITALDPASPGARLDCMLRECRQAIRLPVNDRQVATNINTVAEWKRHQAEAAQGTVNAAKRGGCAF